MRSMSNRRPSSPSLKASSNSPVLEKILSGRSRFFSKSARSDSCPSRRASSISSLSAVAPPLTSAVPIISRRCSNSSFMTAIDSAAVSGFVPRGKLAPTSVIPSLMMSRISSRSGPTPPDRTIDEAIVCRRCSNSFSIASNNSPLLLWSLDRGALAILPSRSFRR